MGSQNSGEESLSGKSDGTGIGRWLGGKAFIATIVSELPTNRELNRRR
jgi:hypothetical protein